MIGQRFRSLGWVAGVTTAATCLYMVSLQVAAERGKLEAVERQIAAGQRDMRQLQTELGTRASLRQLEKWNGDVLALSAPKADQFLHNETQLASLGSGPLVDPTPNAPPAVMNASFAPEPVEAPTLRLASAVRKPADQPARPESASVRSGFQQAIYQRPVQAAHLQRVAMLDVKMVPDVKIASGLKIGSDMKVSTRARFGNKLAGSKLDGRIVSDLSRMAAAEERRKRP